MVHVFIFKLKQGMIHVLRCHFIAVFSKSSLAWPTPASTDLRLCRHKRPRLIYAKDALQMQTMLLKDGTLCTRFRSISSV